MAGKTARCNIGAELNEGSGTVLVRFDFGDDEEAANDFFDIVAGAIPAGEITIGSIQFPPARLAKTEN